MSSYDFLIQEQRKEMSDSPGIAFTIVLCFAYLFLAQTAFKSASFNNNNHVYFNQYFELKIGEGM